MTERSVAPISASASPAAAPAAPTPRPERRRRRVGYSLAAQGEPMVWLTGGALAVCILMILGLVGLIAYQGFATFWPKPLLRLETREGRVLLGELSRRETITRPSAVPEPMTASEGAKVTAMGSPTRRPTRRLLRTGNFELTNTHFEWVDDADIVRETRPEWAMVIERVEWGRFYGIPVEFRVGDKVVANRPLEIWQQFEEHHPSVLAARAHRRELETVRVGAINHQIETSRLAQRATELRHGRESAEYQQQAAAHESVVKATEAEFQRLQAEIARIDAENARFQLVLETASGTRKSLRLDEIVRAYAPNRLSWSDSWRLYGSRWWEFLADDPRESNSEGGVFPAICGTATMTLIMTVVVVPFGVLAALYLREYAKAGLLVSLVRIAVNNLAGVPSIVFGVFGLGFFCYIFGATLDELLFAERLPNPTFGKGGLLWASVTLAFLTLPVVIVATEEALAAVPSSMREGSYACGASTWQTIRRIVLPRALPGIMTGVILAMARGAGEVAPLMLVGAVKLAQELPLDATFPFIHLDRSFMHLSFHIYDLGFQSPNSEAARPMVFTTTLLLIVMISVLNLAAIALRTRLRRRYLTSQF